MQSEELKIGKYLWKNYKRRQEWAKSQLFSIDEMIIQNQILKMMEVFEEWFKKAKSKKQKKTVHQLIVQILSINQYCGVFQERMINQIIEKDDLHNENIALRKQIEKLTSHNTELENKLNKILQNDL